MELEALVAVHEQKITAVEKRIAKLEDISSGLTELKIAIERTNSNVDRVVSSIETLAHKQEEHEQRIDTIEKEPAEKWTALVKQITQLVVAAIVGAVLAYFVR